jgi:AP-2 complex subunit alpha
MATQPRGLQNFISEIKSCQSKDDERARVDKELANIRQKFAASSSLNSYQKKKYVWKMCYIYMLGYDIDFGHIELISLLSSSKFQEKSVGYMGVALLLKPEDEMMNLVVTSIKNDLLGHSDFGKTLALAVVGNFGGMDFAEALGSDVQRMLTHPGETGGRHQGGASMTYEEEQKARALIRKKAALCLLRMYRTNQEVLSIDEWVDQMAVLLADRDVGVLISCMGLLNGFCVTNAEAFEPMVPYVVDILHRLVVKKDCSPDYLYYQTASPWLQVKALRFLQNYGIPSDDAVKGKLNDSLKKSLTKMESADNSTTKNGDYSILFESVNLIISYGGDAESALHESALEFLGRFIALNDSNIRYLGLDAMYKLVRAEGSADVQQHLDVVISSIKESDVSVRKRALDLLFVMTDHSNAEQIVEELLVNLTSSDEGLKDDITVKIAILAEKFAKDLTWYLDTLVKVIMVAGDFVAEDVWHRCVHIVTNHPELHEYAAEKLCEIVQSKYAPETAIALGAYILGEFGVNVCERPGMSGYDQFLSLQQHFPALTLKTKAILLTTYVKMFNLYPDVRDAISEVFQKYSVSGHLELQQRACEYLLIPTTGAETMETVLNTMPAYPDNRESSLTKRLEKKGDGDAAPAPTQRPKAQVNVTEAGAPAAPASAQVTIRMISIFIYSIINCVPSFSLILAGC